LPLRSSRDITRCEIENVKYPKGIDGSLDRAFSGLIREAANYECQHCHKNYRHDTRSMHCAHIHSRKHRATRWHTDGAICLCASCHRRFTDFPLEWADFVRRYYGKDNADDISRLAHTIRKYTSAEKGEMLDHYKAELARIKKLRLEGETGIIELVSYD